MKLFRRLRGLVVILRALFPVLLIVALVIITRQISVEVRAAVAAPMARVNRSIENVQATVKTTQDAIDDLNRNVGSMVDTANAINEKVQIDLGKVSEAVAVQPFTLADKLFGLLGLTIEPDLVTKSVDLTRSIDVLGLGQIKNVFGQVAELFRDVSRITGVASVTQDVDSIVTEIQTTARLLAQILGRWTRILLLLLLLTIGLVLISYVEYLTRALPRGWALLCGRPDPWRPTHRD